MGCSFFSKNSYGQEGILGKKLEINDVNEYFQYCDRLINQNQNQDYLSQPETPLGIRETVTVSLLSISTEHCLSSLELIIKNHFSSAFALFRPAIETSLRAYWINSYLKGKTNTEIAKFIDQNNWPKLNRMMSDLDEFDFKQFLFLKGKMYSTISGWVHGDFEQLHLRLHDNEIGAPPSNEKIMILIFYITNTYLNSMKLMFKTLGKDLEVTQLLATRLNLISVTESYLPEIFKRETK